MSDINEQDEFLLSQLLDGQLPTVEAEHLRERMRTEPELRKAYEALERVHSLVDRRRSDQPSVDWVQFHQQVMDQVDAERSRATRVIRFPRWVAIGVPLAAAAAVALVVLVNRAPAPKAAPDAAGIQVIVSAPVSGDAPGELSVIIERPGVPEEAPIDVAFTQSAEMDELIRQLDEERRSQPSSYASKFEQAPEPTPPSAMEEPPL
jgi:anti-sigma factor RsiW